ncbi:hypothetical protein PPL_03174 [Heterostelium album PN500]|uniref:Iron-binding zinc finger CDGSH type domain-containing protein n=1 Tax=Heterostelium pallidum (strain ATCC 26659 / Pp 5 / PN500) TaxID=670386 RepID=D3B453_HETP5|nr:hypothetical protein PPL_03174 [Heterostelium album PN500]EFA84101.1 hypothetical protein PPL_03174 [Heterostelium album PN500]|eukprot:XP_020436218.1 hypothetical protein PPL_03174 [Heterostelium album PN500]
MSEQKNVGCGHHDHNDDDINSISKDLDTKIHLTEDQCKCETKEGEPDVDMLDLQKSIDSKVNNNNSNSNNDTSNKKTIKGRAEVICSKCGCCKLVPLKIPFYGPYTIRGLQKGVKYEYCTCGLTKNQPFCDKSHVGTGFKPIPFTLEKEQTIWLLCGCRYSQNLPYCDAEHSKLPFNPKDPPCRCDKAKELEF